MRKSTLVGAMLGIGIATTIAAVAGYARLDNTEGNCVIGEQNVLSAMECGYVKPAQPLKSPPLAN